MSNPKDYTLACSVNSVPEMIMSGGEAGYPGSASVTYTSDGEIFGYLPSMPESRVGHCMVALDGDDLFVAGGYIDNQTFFYHHDSEEWEKVEDMPTPRSSHACAMVHNEEGEQEVIVVGGYDEDDLINTVEIYNIPSGKWRGGQLNFFSFISSYIQVQSNFRKSLSSNYYLRFYRCSSGWNLYSGRWF